MSSFPSHLVLLFLLFQLSTSSPIYPLPQNLLKPLIPNRHNNPPLQPHHLAAFSALISRIHPDTPAINKLTPAIKSTLDSTANHLHSLFNSPHAPPSQRSYIPFRTFMSSSLISSRMENLGLTLDDCTTTKECKSSRVCTSIVLGSSTCPTDAAICRCYPTEAVFCSAATDCEDGEICAFILSDSTQFCIAETVVTENPKVFRPPVGSNGSGGTALPSTTKLPSDTNFPPSTKLPPVVTEDPTQPPNSSNGLTSDICRSDNDCQGTRICWSVGLEMTICSPGDDCYCVPTDIQGCSSSMDCDSNEVCTKLAWIELCISEAVANANPDFVPVDSAAEPEVTPEETNGINEVMDTPEPTSVTESPEPIDSSTTSELTDILPMSTPEPTDVTTASTDATPEPMAATPEPEDAATPEPASTTNAPANGSGTEGPAEPVCIDANALKHLDMDDLVFSTHTWARVLCDSSGSCATRGHMVMYHGRAMMMKSYCELVGDCKEEEMYVNSPRYRVARRVLSNTQGLEYTAFAARYETRTEEGLLSAAVRIGL